MSVDLGAHRAGHSAVRGGSAARGGTREDPPVIDGTAVAAKSVRGRRRALLRVDVLFPLGIFLITRLYDVALYSLLARGQAALGAAHRPGYFVYTPLPARPGYLGVITNWDGQWYQWLASRGYPPTAHGVRLSADAMQAWAFPPGFPMLTRAIMSTGLSFAAAASVLNWTCGALAMVLLFQLIDRSAGRFAAIGGVTLTCCFVTAPLLQAAYSESLGLLLLVLAFGALTRRRYATATLVVVLLGLTRIVTPPLAIVAAVHAVARYRTRATDPVTRRDAFWLVALEVCSACGAVSWSLLTRLMTSSSTAAGTRPLAAVDGRNWFAEFYGQLGWVGPLLVLCPVALLVLLAARPAARPWGLELRTWLWCYPLYILAVTPVTTGVLRYLLLCFPLGLVVVGTPRSRSAKTVRALLVIVTALAGLALQAWWLRGSFVVHAGSVMP